MSVKKTFGIEELIAGCDKLLAVNLRTAQAEQIREALHQYLQAVDPIVVRFALQWCKDHGIEAFHIFDLPSAQTNDLPAIQPRYPVSGGKYDA